MHRAQPQDEELNERNRSSLSVVGSVEGPDKGGVSEAVRSSQSDVRRIVLGICVTVTATGVTRTAVA